MQHQTNYVLTFYIWFLSKLEKGNEMFYFIESHYNDFVHSSFNCTRLYIFETCDKSFTEIEKWSTKTF